jgi:uncharacterized protein (UPF0332 family)
MFYLAEGLLLKEKLAFAKHSAVIAAFGREFAKTGRIPEQYHAYLREAAEARSIGDYPLPSGYKVNRFNWLENSPKFSPGSSL